MVLKSGLSFPQSAPPWFCGVLGNAKDQAGWERASVTAQPDTKGDSSQCLGPPRSAQLTLFAFRYKSPIARSMVLVKKVT